MEPANMLEVFKRLAKKYERETSPASTGRESSGGTMPAEVRVMSDMQPTVLRL
jgi:hypothetical protein